MGGYHWLLIGCSEKARIADLAEIWAFVVTFLGVVINGSKKFVVRETKRWRVLNDTLESADLNGLDSLTHGVDRLSPPFFRFLFKKKNPNIEPLSTLDFLPWLFFSQENKNVIYLCKIYTKHIAILIWNHYFDISRWYVLGKKKIHTHNQQSIKISMHCGYFFFFS